MAHFARPKQWEIAAKIWFGVRLYGRLAEKCRECCDGACYCASLLGEIWALIVGLESARRAVVTYW